MNKKVLLTSSALLLSAIIFGNIYTAYASVQEVAPQPVAIVKTTTEPTLKVSVPVEQTKEQVSTPAVSTTTEVLPATNEDLINQYGWNAGPYKESIDHLIEYFPQKFTDENRAASFEYLNTAALAYAVSNNQDAKVGIAFAYVLTSQGRNTETDWNNILLKCQRPMNPTN